MWRFLKKLEIELPCDPAIPLLGAAAGREPVIYQVHLFTELLRVLLTWQLASHRMRHPKKTESKQKATVCFMI